ncbi:hypothetical protein [Paraburkholderia sp. EG304]|uniref:hypothetical protein n=1 Tax=Paraburkholderia sp. EG304 TaxID=3237015 RepID=UPI00397A9A53
MTSYANRPTLLFGVSERAVEAALAPLIENGTGRVCLNARRVSGYCLSGARHVVNGGAATETTHEDAVTTTIATRSAVRSFEGALAGYDSQLQQHRSLAMLARR